MKTYSVFIGLGSNLGERHRFLNTAAAEIRKLPRHQSCLVLFSL